MNFQTVRNPFGIEVIGSTPYYNLGLANAVVSSGLAALSLALRWRQATGIVRQQLEWIALAAAMVALGSPTGSIDLLTSSC